MKAVLLDRPGQLLVVDQPEPTAPGPTDALVATRRVGLCGTDYHAFIGDQNFFTYPRVLGHELAVEVLEIGEEVRNVRVGDSCAVLPYLSCGACVSCRGGRTNCCERLEVLGVTIDGGMRERFVVPASALFGRAGLDLDALALVETLGIGYHAVGRACVSPGQFALVVGAGPIGLAVAQSLLAVGARVAVVDTSEVRVRLAAAMLPIEPLESDTMLGERLRALDDGHLPTVVFDATGRRESMEQSLAFVEFSGSLVLVGHTTEGLTFDNPTLHRREISVLASRNARGVEWLPLLDLIESGVIGATSWIGGRSSLDQVPIDLPRWSGSGGAMLKGIVDVADGIAR